MAHILVVDDDETNLEVAAIICGAAGHVVTTARDGVEAMGCLAVDTFDLLLLDVLMPRLDGLSLTRQLRDDPRYAALPIVAMTAKASKADFQEMLAAGMTAIQTKPFRNKALLATIERVLEVHQTSLECLT